MAQSSGTNWSEMIPGDAAAYRVNSYVSGPRTFLVEDFESGAPGWTEGGTGTAWELGAPTSGPGSAHSGANAYGTNLGGDYVNGTDRYLRSPVVDLTGTASAVIEWYESYDLEPAYDYGHLDVLDTNLSVIADNIYEANGYGALTWSRRVVSVPPGALGQPVILEFRLEADAFDPVGLGWYIDDVTVQE
jgi:bacillopeptidase F